MSFWEDYDKEAEKAGGFDFRRYVDIVGARIAGIVDEVIVAGEAKRKYVTLTQAVIKYPDGREEKCTEKLALPKTTTWSHFQEGVTPENRPLKFPKGAQVGVVVGEKTTLPTGAKYQKLTIFELNGELPHEVGEQNPLEPPANLPTDTGSPPQLPEI